MAKAFVLPSAKSPFGPDVGQPTNVFLKDVLIEGTYQHPISPWDEPLAVTKDYIERLCASTNKAIAAGQSTYIPDGHSNRAEDNVGFAEEFFPRLGEDGKWRVTARCRIEDESYVPKIGKTIRDVSPLIVDWPLGSGQDFGERIEHVALCPDPVMPGQANFVACSLGHGKIETVDVPILTDAGTQERATMKVKVTDSNVKALSLAGITPPAVGAEIEVTPEAFDKALAVATAAQESVVKAEKALADEKALPVEKRLSVDAKAPFFVEAVKNRAEAVKARLDIAMSTGRLTKPMRDSVERLLSVRNAYALSVDGSAAAVDVEATVNSLIESIPANSVVPLGTEGAKPAVKPDNEAPKFDTKAEVEKTLAKMSGKKPAAK